MSQNATRRLVITAVLAGSSQSEVARTYGVSQGWISRLMTRYRTEGEAAFEPRSRAPRTSPSATAAPTVDLVLELRKKLSEAGLDAGADTIDWHLRHHHRTELSRATINRILVRAGAVVADPSKRPKSSYLRFEAAQPNETWQSDFTHYRLADGTDAEILTWIDDHSRYVLHCTAHIRVTGPVVLAAFRQAGDLHRIPRLHTHRQRHGLHHPLLRRPRWTQPSRARTPHPQHRPEELPTQPPHHLRQSRTLPANDEEMATRPTPSAEHARRPPDPARRVRR